MNFGLKLTPVKSLDLQKERVLLCEKLQIRRNSESEVAELDDVNNRNFDFLSFQAKYIKLLPDSVTQKTVDWIEIFLS